MTDTSTIIMKWHHQKDKSKQRTSIQYFIYLQHTFVTPKPLGPDLSLIHIQMCIRDKCQGLHVYFSKHVGGPVSLVGFSVIKLSLKKNVVSGVSEVKYIILVQCVMQFCLYSYSIALITWSNLSHNQDIVQLTHQTPSQYAI